MTRQFQLVDVFGEGPFTGNALAVVAGAEDLDTEANAAHHLLVQPVRDQRSCCRRPKPTQITTSASSPLSESCLSPAIDTGLLPRLAEAGGKPKRNDRSSSSAVRG